MRGFGELADKAKALSKIDIGREGIVRSWKFNKMSMRPNGYWELIIDFEKDIPEAEMFYDLSLVKDPYNENYALNSLLTKAHKTGIFIDKEILIEQMERIHLEYHKEAELIGRYDFKASLKKFEKKISKRQLVFYIKEEVALWLAESHKIFHKTAMVLAKGEAPKLEGDLLN